MPNTLTDREPCIQPALLPTFRLVFSGNRAVLPSRLYVLRQGAMRLGREVPVSSGIRLAEDTLLSSTHASLHINRAAVTEAPTVELADARSKNGTFVNDNRVASTRLVDGDVVQVGSSFFVYRLEQSSSSDAPEGRLLGQSPVMVALRQELVRVAASPAEILLFGESGTGKDLAAETLHKLREKQGRTGEFVPVNGAEIVETLAASEFFGHAAGAFTNAKGRSEGFFQKANGGTLFLDEIGDMPPPIQAKLLRAIEQQQIRRVGSNTLDSVDVRLIAATNRDLRQGIREGWFRGDLYMRLAGLRVMLPPLRARREDILQLFSFHCGGVFPSMAPRLASWLLLYPYEFNVRQLKKIAADLLLHAQTGVVLDIHMVRERSYADDVAIHTDAPRLADLPSEKELPQPASTGTFQWGPRKIPPKEAVIKWLLDHRGNIEGTARTVRCSPRALSHWIEKYKIDVKAMRLDAKNKR